MSATDPLASWDYAAQTRFTVQVPPVRDSPLARTRRVSVQFLSGQPEPQPQPQTQEPFVVKQEPQAATVAVLAARFRLATVSSPYERD